MELKHHLENSQITLDDIKHKIKTKSDVILIGAGIMSATLGILLKELDPTLTITILEKLDAAARESTNAWNNAGTGHSAFCELNYTPMKEDGSVNCKKAFDIASLAANLFARNRHCF